MTIAQKTISHADQIRELPGADFLATSNLPTTPRATDAEAWLDHGVLKFGSSGISRMAVGRDFMVGKMRNKFTLANADCPWVTRDGPRIVFLNGNYYMLGGWNSLYGNPLYADPTWNGSITTNECWKITNRGADFERVKLHATTPVDNQYVRRHTFGAEVIGEWLYVFGSDHLDGFAGGNSAVTRTQDCVAWEQRAAHGTPGWAGKILGCYGKLGNDLYQLGGLTQLTTPEASPNMWKGTNEGANWVQMPDVPFAPRTLVTHMPEWKGRMWLVCGGRYALLHADRVYYNGVFAWDGSEWETILPDGNDQLPAVFYNDVFVWNDKLWTSRGFNSQVSYPGASAGNQQRLHCSDNGYDWVEVECPLEPSHADGVGAGPRGVVFAGGNYTINLLGKTSRFLSLAGFE